MYLVPQRGRCSRPSAPRGRGADGLGETVVEPPHDRSAVDAGTRSPLEAGHESEQPHHLRLARAVRLQERPEGALLARGQQEERLDSERRAKGSALLELRTKALLRRRQKVDGELRLARRIEVGDDRRAPGDRLDERPRDAGESRPRIRRQDPLTVATDAMYVALVDAAGERRVETLVQSRGDDARLLLTLGVELSGTATDGGLVLPADAEGLHLGEEELATEVVQRVLRGHHHEGVAIGDVRPTRLDPPPGSLATVLAVQSLDRGLPLLAVEILPRAHPLAREVEREIGRDGLARLHGVHEVLDLRLVQIALDAAVVVEAEAVRVGELGEGGRRHVEGEKQDVPLPELGCTGGELDLVGVGGIRHGGILDGVGTGHLRYQRKSHRG